MALTSIVSKDRTIENRARQGEFTNELSLSKILKYETHRYKKKGKYLIHSILLNILFFTLVPYIIQCYMPYSDQIEGKGGKTHFIWTVATHTVVYLLVNGFYLILYYFQFPFIEQFKVVKEPWPWKEDWENFKPMLLETVKWSAFNIIFLMTGASYLSCYFDDCPHSFNKEDIPSGFTIFLQCTFCALCDDIYFYFGHRFFHTTSMYNLFHKTHHTHKVSLSFGAEFAHPVEYMTVNLISSFLGPSILGYRMHYSSYICWLIYITWEAHESHSGYEFPISLFDIVPFTNPAEFHIYHHLKFRGNYGGMFFFWDRILNSVNTAYMKYFYSSLETQNLGSEHEAKKQN